MADPWDERFDAYRHSRTHAGGPDLDSFIAWCEPEPGMTVLDVATGGGHVARRLRDCECLVTTCDAAPGMQPDVVCRAEALPFADESFDLVACRLAAHHFSDVAAAIVGDGPREPRPDRRRGHPVHQRRGRASRTAARPDARALLHRGGVARVLRRGATRRARGRLLRQTPPDGRMAGRHRLHRRDRRARARAARAVHRAHRRRLDRHEDPAAGRATGADDTIQRASASMGGAPAGRAVADWRRRPGRPR